MNSYPKVTIVTPNYNLGEYLEQTILSILNQNYPNLEYIIIDGGSTDNSVEIIKKYEDKLAFWVSESDNGMYDAIQKGFDKSTGEIMGWLNSDDMLHPNSLFYIADIFCTFPNVEWIQGRPSFFDKDGGLFNVGDIKRWSKYHFLTGNFQWIQQESTFWKRDLWIKTGGSLNTKLQLAGDFDLWLRFFDKSSLYSTSVILGGFRHRINQLSKEKYQQYLNEANQQLRYHIKKLSLVDRLKIASAKFLFFLLKIILKIKIFNTTAIRDKVFPFLIGAEPIIHFDYTNITFHKND